MAFSRPRLRLALSLVSVTAGLIESYQEYFVYALFIPVGVELFLYVQSVQEGLTAKKMMKFCGIVVFYSFLCGLGFTLGFEI